MDHSLDSSVEIVDVSDGTLTPRGLRHRDENNRTPKRSFLESVSSRFEQNKKEREERVRNLRSKQEIEKVHSRYLKNNVTSPYELDRARPVVNAWAQRNGRQRGGLTERQRRVLMEIETVNERNTTRQQRIVEQNISNNADDYSERCAVIGCGMKFTCQQAHITHDQQFEHSPCNPLLNIPNGHLPQHPLGYICPKCGEDFQRGIDCKEHMVMLDHLSLFSPLPVCAYMCPQCLLFFPEKMRCHKHMEELHHFEPAYPFSDDLASDPSTCPRTIPVPTCLGQDFIHKVKESNIKFCVSCVECGLNVSSQEQIQQHRHGTEESPVFTASTRGNLVEVFAEYLGDQTCNACLQILKGPVSTNGIHQCTTGMQGNLVDINCKSFIEFVRRTGLTLSQTVAVENNAVVVITSGPNSPVSASPGHESDVTTSTLTSSYSSSSSSSHKFPRKSPVGRKRMLSVTVLSSSSEDEQEEGLIHSPWKKRKVEIPGTSACLQGTFSNTIKRLATDLQVPTQTDGFKCDTQSKGLEKEEFDAVKVRNEGGHSCTEKSPEDANFRLNDKLLSTTFNAFKDAKTNTQPSGTLNLKRPEHRESTQPSAQTNPTVNSVHVIDGENGRSRQTTSGFALPPIGFVHASGPSFLDSIPASARRAGDPENLDKMRLVIFLDLDNWGGFFKKLPQCLPDKTFVWAFYGGKNLWKPPRYCVPYQRLLDSGCLHFHEQCGSSKDAADFAICLTVGKMDERLPKHVPFTILSGDKGFLEVERQMKLSTRRTVVIDPHNVQEKSNDVLYTMIVSVIHD